MKEINYSKNWNNKLNCLYHTTIRLYNDEWKVGEKVMIKKNNELCFRGTIIKIGTFFLNELKEITAYLDTGKSLAETKEIIKKIYPNKDFSKEKLMILLIKNNENEL